MSSPELKRLLLTPVNQSASFVKQIEKMKQSINNSQKLELLDPETYFLKLKDVQYCGLSILGFDADVFAEFSYLDIKIEAITGSYSYINLDFKQIGEQQAFKLCANGTEYFLLSFNNA